MATPRSTKILAVGFVSMVVLGCEGILGTFTVAPDLNLGPETGTDANTSSFDASGDVSVPADADGPETSTPTTRSCESAFDCPAVAIEPAGCGIVRCIDKKCRGVAVDRDSDGHAVAGCKVDGTLVGGYADGKDIPADDCDDNKAAVYPGAECAETAAGQPITFPTGSPVGRCKRGAWACEPGPVCKGALGPANNENCTLKNDADCDGVKDNGCDCDPSDAAPKPCGNVNNLPAPCKAGTRSCLATGKWSACTGNVEPSAPDCSSNGDNNCNGTKDNQEPGCKCDGTVAVGASQSCTDETAQGACMAGTKTCELNSRKEPVFGKCAGRAPGAAICSSSVDNNCNGTPDELEVGCGSPCLAPGPTRIPLKVAAAQKFNASMWGCRGTNALSGASNACNGKVCPIGSWSAYISPNPKLPPPLVKPRAPTHKYWVAEKLGYGGSFPGACYANANTDAYDCGPDSSMAVCPSGGGALRVTDAEGNVCNWSDCSYGGAYTDNDFLGGCGNNLTGGTLCCP